MTKREELARVLSDRDYPRRYSGQLDQPTRDEYFKMRRTAFLGDADAVLVALREPTEEMLATSVTMTDLTCAHWDKAAAVLEGMPPLPPARQEEGLRAVADMYRDWQAMIDKAREE